MACAGPGCNRCRGPPAQIADRRCCEWNTFVDDQPLARYSRNRAGFRLHCLRDQYLRHYHRRGDPAPPNLRQRGHNWGSLQTSRVWTSKISGCLARCDNETTDGDSSPPAAVPVTRAIIIKNILCPRPPKNGNEYVCTLLGRARDCNRLSENNF